jgi:hypothetical protein
MKAILELNWMPENCMECVLCVNGTCVTTGYRIEDYHDKRFEGCPLKPVEGKE